MAGFVYESVDFTALPDDVPALNVICPDMVNLPYIVMSDAFSNVKVFP